MRLLSLLFVGIFACSDRDGIPWQEAQNYLEQTIKVRGQIVRTHNSGKACFLNFDKDWQGKFHLVLFPSSFPDYPLPPEDFFLGREVLVRGKIGEYKGTPQMKVESPEQFLEVDGRTDLLAAIQVAPGIRGLLPRADGTNVRLVSWNLKNFFDEEDDPWRQDERTNPASVSSARSARIAAVIRELDADLLCLQEVENRFHLEQFVRKHLPDLHYEVVLLEGNDGRGIDVAVLSRLPIRSSTSYRHLEFPTQTGGSQRFFRDLLRVDLGPPLSASVFVVHLKSQIGGDSADRSREAEALGIARVLGEALQANPRLRAVLIGDFNEVLGEPTLDILLATGLSDPFPPDAGPTYNRQPYLTRIDYALVSPAVAPQVMGTLIYNKSGAVKIENASDHYPVVLDLRCP